MTPRADLSNRASYLPEFIKDHGQNPPVDWNNFICWGSRIGIYSDHCFLCGIYSYFFKECSFLNHVSMEVETVCACKKCGTIIEDTLEQPLEDLGIDFNQKGPPQLKDHTKLKIKTYFTTGVPPIDYQVYTQLATLENYCMFCNGGLGYHVGKGHLTLDLPINEYSNKIIGPVKMCSYCTQWASTKNYIGPNACQLTSEFIETDSCSICSEPYLITPQEGKVRQGYSTLERHLCHTCLQKHDLIGEQRMVELSCPSPECLYSVIIDQTLDPRYIEKIVCENCMGKEKDYLDAYEIGDGEVIVILKEDKISAKGYYYKITIKTDRQSKILGRCTDYFDDPIVAFMTGVEHGKKIWRKLYEEEKARQILLM